MSPDSPIEYETSTPDRRRRWRIVLLLTACVACATGWWCFLRCPGGPYDSYDPLARLPRESTLGPELRIAVWGDTQPRWDGEREELGWHPMAAVIRELVKGQRPHLAVLVGDLVDASHARLRGNPDVIPRLWNGFRAFYEELMEDVPFLPCIGNHDLGCDGYESFFELPRSSGSERYWTTEVANVRFVSLDSNRPDEFRPGGAQRRFVDEVLGSQGPEHTVVFFHHPPFTVGPSDASERASIHESLVPHARAISVVLCGHDHLYYRTHRGGLTYVVTGGGGWYLSDLQPQKVSAGRPDDRSGSFHHALLLQVTRGRLRVTCLKHDGTVFDTFEP